MRQSNIVVGQHVEDVKVERARQLRRQMTAEERILWHRLRGNKVGGFHFRRQQVIDGFIADFYCHAAGLVVEVDGPVHEGCREYDAGRDQVFQQRGIRPLRFTNEDVRNRLEGVLRVILQTCAIEVSKG